MVRAIQAREDMIAILKEGLQSLSNGLAELQSAVADFAAFERSALEQLSAAEARYEEGQREFACVTAAIGELESTAATLAQKNQAFRQHRRQLRAAAAEAGTISEEAVLELAAVSLDLESICSKYDEQVIFLTIF